MASYNKKDIERLRSFAGVSARQAVALLRRYHGRADRVLEEEFGATRVYVEPVAVREPRAEFARALKDGARRCLGARLVITRHGRVLAELPLLPAVLTAALTAPVSLPAAALCALLLSCRFDVAPSGGFAMN